MTNVCSCSVVLNMTVTVPVALNRLPTAGRPMPPPASTFRKPATPGIPLTVVMMSRPVALPKVSWASPMPNVSSAVTYSWNLGVADASIDR